MTTLRERAKRLCESWSFQRTIMVLIAVNAIALGLETSPTISERFGSLLGFLDSAVLVVFVLELALRGFAYRWAFFKDGWNIFDFIVVAVALLPATEAFAVLRALRALRILRLASAVPRMRRVVEALLDAVPGLGAVVSILLLIFYIAGVMATVLFGEGFPEWFGSLPRSIYSLFQIMTLESWSMGIVRPVMEVYPYAWGFFVPFILIATFTMLNLFIAVVVNAMQSGYHEQEAQHAEAAHAEREEMLATLRALKVEVGAIRAAMDEREGMPQSAPESEPQSEPPPQGTQPAGPTT